MVTLTLGTAEATFRVMPLLGWPHAVFEVAAASFWQGDVLEDLGVAEAEFDAQMLTPYLTDPPEHAAQFSLGGFEVAQFALHTAVSWSPNLHIHIPTAFGFEREDIPIRARLVTKQKVPVVQADVAMVLVRAYDLAAADPTADIFAIELNASEVITDSLVTDGSWDADSRGYNFSYTIPGRATFLKGGGKYKLEYIVELNDENTYTMTGAVAVRPVLAFQETPIA